MLVYRRLSAASGVTTGWFCCTDQKTPAASSAVAAAAASHTPGRRSQPGTAAAVPASGRTLSCRDGSAVTEPGGGCGRRR